MRIHDRRVEKSVSNWSRVFMACGGLWLVAPDALAARVLPPAHPPHEVSVEIPPHLAERACSFQHTVCAHATEGATALAVLDSIERAWDAGRALGVPLPDSYDAYAFGEASRSAIFERDELSHFDRARAFSIVDARVPAGCARDFLVARELYAASALERNPAIDFGTLRGETTALAETAVPCAFVDETAFQSNPDRAIVDAHVAPSYDDGASLFFAFLDDSFATQPGHAITASWALAPTVSTVDTWNDTPDVFSVLRESMKDAMFADSTFEDTLVAFAIARGTRAQPRARLDWDVAWPAVARTLAAPEGIAPTGSAFVRIDTTGRAPGKRLRVDAKWEELAKLRWTLVKLDANGNEIARVAVTVAPKATEGHGELVELDGASAVLVVATNVDAWSAPFDPDDEFWEPHGWLLTIAEE